MSTIKLYSTVKGSGPCLLLIHGWGSSHRIWNVLLPRLTKHYQVVLIDLPGHGSSSWLEPSSVPLLSQWLLKQIPQPQICLGWSLGGLFALYMATLLGSACQRVISVSCNPCFLQKTDWPYGMPVAQAQIFQKKVQRNPEKQWLNFMEQHIPKDHRGTSIPAHPPETEVLRSSLNWLYHTDLRDHLAQISCSVTQIVGAHDPLVSVEALRAAEAYYHKAQTCVIAESGHAPFLEQTEHFLKELKLDI